MEWADCGEVRKSEHTNSIPVFTITFKSRSVFSLYPVDNYEDGEAQRRTG